MVLFSDCASWPSFDFSSHLRVKRPQSSEQILMAGLGKGGRACKCLLLMWRECVCVGWWAKMEARQQRRALQVGGSSVAGGCRVATSHGAGAEVESITLTGALSRPLSFGVPKNICGEWHKAASGLHTVQGEGVQSVQFWEQTLITSTRLLFAFVGLSQRGCWQLKTPGTYQPIQNTAQSTFLSLYSRP